MDIKKAVPKEENRNGMPSQHTMKTNKVFLGGIAPETTDDDIRAAIGYSLDEVQVMTKKESDEPRGFAFAFFTNPSDIDTLLEKGPRIKIRVCSLVVKARRGYLNLT